MPNTAYRYADDRDLGKRDIGKRDIGKRDIGKRDRDKRGARKRTVANKRRQPASRQTPNNSKFEGSRLQKIKAVSQGYDFSILFVVLLLTLFGIVMVFSSSYYYALTSPTFGMYHFFQKQATSAVLGVCAMILMLNFDYHVIKKFAWIGYLSVNGLLVLVLTMEAINGSSRWLEVMGTSLQPSEIAKVMIIIFMSAMIDNNKGRLKKFSGFLYCSALVAVPVVLIAASNLSTAIVVAFIGFSIIFIASPKVWHFVILAIPAGVGGAIGITMFAYRVDRIVAWLDPFADPTGLGFQTVQSLYAIGSGGLFGLGLGQSRQKLYIPESYNDIIFSIICEEIGLIGAVAIISLFMVLIWRGVRIALNAHDLLGTLMATGVVALIGIQVLINIAVVTATIPVTGMALPFISFGGSSLLFLMTAVGILLNISKYCKN